MSESASEMAEWQARAENRWRRRLRPSKPACWGWAPPTPEKLADVRRRLTNGCQRYGAGLDYTPEEIRWVFMREWMRERCAICGRRLRLYEDHDHETGLFRGFLCNSCNTNEGNPMAGLVFDRYRVRHPAIIFNIKREYVYVGGWRYRL